MSLLPRTVVNTAGWGRVISHNMTPKHVNWNTGILSPSDGKTNPILAMLVKIFFIIHSLVMRHSLALFLSFCVLLAVGWLSRMVLSHSHVSSGCKSCYSKPHHNQTFFLPSPLQTVVILLFSYILFILL